MVFWPIKKKTTSKFRTARKNTLKLHGRRLLDASGPGTVRRAERKKIESFRFGEVNFVHLRLWGRSIMDGYPTSWCNRCKSALAEHARPTVGRPFFRWNFTVGFYLRTMENPGFNSRQNVITFVTDTPADERRNSGRDGRERAFFFFGKNEKKHFQAQFSGRVNDS